MCFVVAQQKMKGETVASAALPDAIATVNSQLPNEAQVWLQVLDSCPLMQGWRHDNTLTLAEGAEANEITTEELAAKM